MKMLFFLADIFTKSKSVSFMRKYYQKNATSLLAKITFCKTFTNTFLSLALILALFISRTISRRRLSVENIYFKVYAFTITLYIYTLHSIFRYQTKKTDLDECRGGHPCYFSQPDIRAFLTCCYFLDPPPLFRSYDTVNEGWEVISPPSPLSPSFTHMPCGLTMCGRWLPPTPTSPHLIHSANSRSFYFELFDILKFFKVLRYWIPI